ncbi:hypothetical protein CJU89_2962 [Yarrowia sp. B02]|nr:hypothetical protein CJU89_2962 [Yarrowia sp. B02]
MSSLQPFSVDNTWRDVVVKRTGDKREYGGDLSSESSNFLPTDQTDKQPSSPGLCSESWSVDLPSSPARKKRFLGGVQFERRLDEDYKEGSSKEDYSEEGKDYSSYKDKKDHKYSSYNDGDAYKEGSSYEPGEVNQASFQSLQSNGTVTEEKAKLERSVATNSFNASSANSANTGSVSLNANSFNASINTPTRTASRPSLLAPTTPYRNYTRSYTSFGSLGSFGETGAGIAAEVASPEKRKKPVVDSNLPPAQYLLQCADKEVENIDLMFRNLDKLPQEFGELRHVVKSSDSPCQASLTMSYKVMLSQNRLCELPGVLFEGINIVNLSVFNNRLEHVPPRIRDLKNLDTLNVSGNSDLLYLPSDLELLPKLKNLKASNVGFPPLPKDATQPSGKKRRLLHREYVVVNEDKDFPSLIETVVAFYYKQKGSLSDKQIAQLNVHQMGRQYFEDAQESFLLGTRCGVCKEHVLYEDRVWGYATEWWQWPGHEEVGTMDQQVVVLRRLLCRKSCRDLLEKAE